MSSIDPQLLWSYLEATTMLVFSDRTQLLHQHRVLKYVSSVASKNDQHEALFFLFERQYALTGSSVPTTKSQSGTATKQHTPPPRVWTYDMMRSCCGMSLPIFVLLNGPDDLWDEIMDDLTGPSRHRLETINRLLEDHRNSFWAVTHIASSINELLSHAIWKGNHAIVNRLRRQGAELNVLLEDYPIPPVAALQRLISGSEIHRVKGIRKTHDSARNFKDWDARRIQMSLISAISSFADDATLQRIITMASSETRPYLGPRRTPVIEAIRAGDTNMLEHLLKLGASPNQCCNNSVSPLMYATAWREQGSIDVLLAHGADLRYKDRNGNDAASYTILYIPEVVHTPKAYGDEVESTDEEDIWRNLQGSVLRDVRGKFATPRYKQRSFSDPVCHLDAEP